MPNLKLTAEQAAELRKRALAGERNVDLAKEFPISASEVGRIVSGQRWSTLGCAAFRAGRGKGVQHFQAKIVESQVRLMRLQYKEGKTYRELAEAAGVSIRTVFNVVKRKTWKHVE